MCPQSPSSTNTNNNSSQSNPVIGSQPNKRSRKIINCQPCRASKLKCDRARPCSSCILRGTTSLCYPDGKPDVRGPSYSTQDELRCSSTDPQTEIQRIRHSLSQLEAHILRSVPHPSDSTVMVLPRSVPEQPHYSRARYTDNKSAPATLAKQTDAGYYAGPTSSATHLLGQKEPAAIYSKEQTGDPIVNLPSPESISYVDDQGDHDLLNSFPEPRVVDQILLFFIDHCCTMNWYIQKSTLFSLWESFKSGIARARLTLALVYCIIAATTQFLPPQDQLFLYIRREHVGSISELSEFYYELSCQALSLHENDSTMPSLELVEVYLMQMFYLGISKNHAEEIWRLKGCAMSTAIALGLHRDPSKWNMLHPIAERRRWAWYNVLRVERWHAFMLGRPTSVNNNHFDTVFPSSIDPFNTDHDCARNHLAQVHFFKLMIYLGDIMNDMVSVLPVPYENIMAHQQVLDGWFNDFPDELKYDTKDIGSAFVGEDAKRRRSGVQSLCFKLAGLHIQLAMHRPYATNTSVETHPNGDHSLELAVQACHAIVSLTTHARPNYLSNPALTVPGHIHWGVLHLFAAMMFLTFQVISRPDQDGVPDMLFTITNGIIDMESLRGIPAADKANNIMDALKPLFQDNNDANEGDIAARHKKKESILRAASKLPFPFLDLPGQRTHRGGTRSVHSVSPPAMSNSPSASSTSNNHDSGAHPGPVPNHTVPNIPVVNGGGPAFIPIGHFAESAHQNLYMDRRGPILPTQLQNPGDETFWSSAVGVETGDWARLMHDVAPTKNKQRARSGNHTNV